MNLFKNICFSIFLMFLFSCSQEETAHPPGGSPSDFPEGGGIGDTQLHAVVPIELSPQDKEKARMAPEGKGFIKGGCFIMGNDFAQTDEAPEHEVCVDNFFMDKYEVTQARWESVMGFNPSKYINKDAPVEQINYYDIQEYKKKSQETCRLPTEAEWEYAAGGRTQTRYYWGNMMDDEYAWFEDNSGGRPHSVGQKKPNQFGLYDMMGNIWEWTDDWYGPMYEMSGKDNPRGNTTGDFKVIRGGGFDASAGALRTTNRTWVHPKNRVFPKVTTFGQVVNKIYNYIGFRCAMSIPQ